MQRNVKHIVRKHSQNTTEKRLQELLFVAFFFVRGKIAHLQKQHHKHKEEQPQADNSPLRQLEEQFIMRCIGNGFEFTQIGITEQGFGLVLLKGHLEISKPAAHYRTVQKDFLGNIPHKQALVKRLEDMVFIHVKRNVRRGNEGKFLGARSHRAGSGRAVYIHRAPPYAHGKQRKQKHAAFALPNKRTQGAEHPHHNKPAQGPQPTRARHTKR